MILAANPDLHIESLQPAVRIILVDALERWGASLEGAAPVFTLETAYELADRIVNPRPPQKEEPTEPPPETADQSQEEREPSRASAIFRAADEAKPFDPAELGFAFEEGDNLEEPSKLSEPSPEVAQPSKAGAKKRFLGMTTPQLLLLGGMILFEVCLLVGLALSFFLNS